MGAAQSSTPITNGGPPKSSCSNLKPGHFGVSIAGDIIDKGLKLDENVDELIKNAHQKGKDEGLAELKTMLSSVAAEVYENVNNQITEYQEKHVGYSKELVRYLQRFLYFYYSLYKTIN